MNEEAALPRPLFFCDPLVQVILITATDLIDLERWPGKSQLNCSVSPQ